MKAGVRKILCLSFKDSGASSSYLLRIQERPLSFLSRQGDVLLTKMLQSVSFSYSVILIYKRHFYHFKSIAIKAGPQEHPLSFFDGYKEDMEDTQY